MPNAERGPAGCAVERAAAEGLAKAPGRRRTQRPGTGTVFRFQSAVWLDRVPSTNAELLQLLADGAPLPCGYVLATRAQTAGRGRGGRSWTTRPGRDLAFSFVVTPAPPGECLLSLPMAVALGVAECLRALGVPAQTKWPNDVLVRGRKIAGILAEGTGEALVVGVGLNVNMTAAEAAAIDQPATSVRVETGCESGLDIVLRQVLAAVGDWLGRWRDGGFEAIRAAWMAQTVWVGAPVEIRDGDRLRRGTLVGFGDSGELLLQEGGERIPVWSGDLRPVAGSPLCEDLHPS
jgi:BirA family transcriptional regulator, biotin operon repressor / biotin---[acetyl-CoA-carboxylase] ligase